MWNTFSAFRLLTSCFMSPNGMISSKLRFKQELGGSWYLLVVPG